MAERLCIECGGPMERGFVADHGHGTLTQEYWVSGAPETGRFTGNLKLKETRQYLLETFRCAQCGAVRSYALDEKPK